jgi:hypothetical protein
MREESWTDTKDDDGMFHGGLVVTWTSRMRLSKRN